MSVRTGIRTVASRFSRSQLSHKNIFVFAAIFAVVGGVMIFKSFAATTVGTLEAESMTGSGQIVSDSSASGSRAMLLTTNSPVTGTMTTSAVATDLNVVAKGVQCHGAPQGVITVDGKKLLTANVTSTSWTIYTATLSSSLPAASHTVTATFTNPYKKGNCSRALYLDVINALNNTPPPPPSDTTPPTVSITSPSTGSMVSGVTTVMASASDNVGVTKVQFSVDGTIVSTVTASPYNFAWDTTTVPNGTHSVTATAYDAAGNSSSTVNNVTVSNTSVSLSPPSAAGYLTLQPVGSWSSLPSDSQCAAQVHYSSWEPRPENAQQNSTMPAAGAMAASFAARPRDQGNTYNSLWDSWLLPRVDGQFTGTTDEILQWAACKWGLPDNLIRADAADESTWFEYLHFPNSASAGGGGGGNCYWNRGCGDAFPSATTDSTTYCQGIATLGILSSEQHDYQRDPLTTYGKYPFTPGVGLCPETFSILGIKSWENPAWEAPYPPYAGNQNGTFPYTRDSTAAAADYWGAQIRGCYEGWESWLKNTGTGTYAAGDIWGCIGAWYSGDWYSTAANGYISNVQNNENSTIWLDPTFDSSTQQYHCDPTYGCPQ